MRHILSSLLLCTLFFVIVSCSKNNPVEEEKYSTSLEATVTIDFIDIYNFSFTLNGTPIVMKREKNGNTTTFSYSDSKLHGDEKVECAVSIASGANVASVPETCSFSIVRSYKSGQLSGEGYSKFFSSSGRIDVGGLSYAKMLEDEAVTDKASFVTYIGSRIATTLSGTLR